MAELTETQAAAALIENVYRRAPDLANPDWRDLGGEIHDYG